jgi:endogenous inhibitor of DNA gyrase (YacG/DUF329 family)
VRVNGTPGREVPCPTCGSPTLYGPANPWRPFCSERCRRVDLGAWASERFRVPAANTTDERGAVDEGGGGDDTRH